jgi:hypothetical protein
MTGPAFEAFLTRIYVDPAARAEFLREPWKTAERAGLSPEECQAMERIDREGLEMAAHSYAKKRANSTGA